MVTLPWANYVFLVAKPKFCYKSEFHDGSTLIKCYHVFLRIMIVAIVSILLALPKFLITVEMVGSPIIIMFTSFIIPIALISYFMSGGPYDYIVGQMN